MSLKFNWPDFEQQSQFVELTKQSLTDVLNEGEQPSSIVGPIKVTRLVLGSQPPDIEILSITDASLSQETFGATVKLMYEGDALIELETVVQANPISTTSSLYSTRAMKRLGVLCAHKELEVPLKLTISCIKFAGVLAINKSKELLDIRFKSDPLRSVQITSTFDSLSSARKVVQHMVEGQLRDFIMVKLPIMASKINSSLAQPTTSVNYSTTEFPFKTKSGLGDIIHFEISDGLENKLRNQCA